MYTNLLINSIEVLKFLVIFNLIFHRRIKEKTGKYTGLIVLVGLLVLMSYVLHSDDQIVAIIVLGVELFLIYSGIVWNKILLFLITIVATNYLDSFLLAIGSYAIKGKVTNDNTVEINTSIVAYSFSLLRFSAKIDVIAAVGIAVRSTIVLLNTE